MYFPGKFGFAMKAFDIISVYKPWTINTKEEKGSKSKESTEELIMLQTIVNNDYNLFAFGCCMLFTIITFRDTEDPRIDHSR